MHKAQDQIIIQASPDQVFQILSDLHRLPEWYVPSEAIEVLTEGPIRVGWQFRLAVRTLGGILLQALGTVQEFKPQDYAITWRGQAMGITGNSCWQAHSDNNKTILKHTFEGSGWMLFLSNMLGRNDITVRARLTNLKKLVETETL